MKFGIDVSYANGEVDWEALKDKIDFAILRVAWLGNKNNSEEDSQYRRNYNECKRLGIPISGYVYSYCESEEALEKGAEKVLEILANDHFELPLFLDLEDPQISYIDKQTLTRQALVFCNYIEESSDLKCGVYANLDWFKNHLDEYALKLYDVPLWLAHWGVDPEKYKESDYMMLQYTDDWEGFDGNFLYEETDSDSGDIDCQDDLEIPYRYQNGSTFEDVYSDTEGKNKIGYLNKYENVPCLGVFQNRAIVLYKVDNSELYKIGFCKWLGGVKC